ncbi:MAG TPA: arginine--tRNA ligase [Chthoniobacterales bacterium]|nr:arginine--tRNA ligase [Chthoniobacterales bacterium]
METFQKILARSVSEALKKAELPEAGEVTPATDPRFGDYQTNAALILGKQRGENPRKVAAAILAHLDTASLTEPPTVAGAGFINFTLRREAVEARVNALLRDDRFGVPKAATPKRIVIDLGSPNVAKPMHVGHIRSLFLGDALARIAQFMGHEVIRDNHIGDWGTQFGMVIWGWKNLLDRDRLQKDPIDELVRIYKETNEKATKDPQIREAARQELVKLQSGDPENVSIWRETVELSLREFERAYRLLDIHYDIQRGESFYNDRLGGVVERLLKRGIAQISEGAVCVFFPDIPELADKPAIIRKQDGGFNYATTDVATTDYRTNDLKADAAWYVVGAPQSLHFRQIFEIARREGGKAELRHIPFGSILGEDRKLMKTRSGESVPLRELLEEAIARARKIVDEKNPGLTEAEKADVAQKIGIGAVKYADLSQYRMTDYVFSWDKMLSLHGNTAPYLQNAYVRIRSIFRKAGDCSRPAASGRDETPRHSDELPPLIPKSPASYAVATTDKVILNEPAEIAIGKRLAQFAEVVPQVLNDFRPNILANYLFELANNFHTFYEACPVLKAEDSIRASRLALSDLTGRVLRQGLELLGIDVPEKM